VLCYYCGVLFRTIDDLVLDQFDGDRATWEVKAITAINLFIEQENKERGEHGCATP
jgi:hypothetical protein